LTDP
jgi:hypothetical protein